jgi:hypothetical protein
MPLLVFGVAQVRWIQPRILAYYSQRFGRVRGSYRFSGVNLMSQGFVPISLLADAHRPWLIVVAALALMAAWPAWIAVRDWPYRWHWLPAVLVAVLMAPDMALRPSYHAALQHVGGWGLAVGAALAFAGWFDHRLLVRTLTASLCDIAAGEPTR